MVCEVPQASIDDPNKYFWSIFNTSNTYITSISKEKNNETELKGAEDSKPMLEIRQHSA